MKYSFFPEPKYSKAIKAKKLKIKKELKDKATD